MKNAKWLEQKYWGERLTLRQIGALVGRDDKTVHNWMKRLGIRIRSSGEARKGKVYRHMLGKNLAGAKNPCWRGGRTKHKASGRFYIKAPDSPMADCRGYVQESRLVMSKIIGRPLFQEEVVHHEDGEPSNNQEENLELFATTGEHSAYHRALERSN